MRVPLPSRHFDLPENPEIAEFFAKVPSIRHPDSLDLPQVGPHGAAVAEIRGRIAASAADGTNLLPLLVEAVKADITLGEISQTLREVWGTWGG